MVIMPQDGITPLMAASKKGQRDVVKVLLANGADVTIVSVRVCNVHSQCTTYAVFYLFSVLFSGVCFLDFPHCPARGH